MKIKKIFLKKVFNGNIGAEDKFRRIINILTFQEDLRTSKIIDYLNGGNPPDDFTGLEYEDNETLMKVFYVITASSPIVFKMKTELVQTNETTFVFSENGEPTNLTINKVLDPNPFRSNQTYNLYIDNDKSKVGTVKYVSSNGNKHEFKIIEFEISMFPSTNAFCQINGLNNREVWIKSKTTDFMEDLVKTMKEKKLNTNYSVFQKESDKENRKWWIETYNKVTHISAVTIGVGLAVAGTTVTSVLATETALHAGFLSTAGHIATGAGSYVAGAAVLTAILVESVNQVSLCSQGKITRKKALKNVATTTLASGTSATVGYLGASAITGYALPLIATATGPVGLLIFSSSFAIGYYATQSCNLTEKISTILDEWMPEDTSDINKEKAVKEVHNDAFKVLGFTDGLDDERLKDCETKHKMFLLAKAAFRTKILDPIDGHPDKGNKAIDATNTTTSTLLAFNYIKENYNDPNISDVTIFSESRENGNVRFGPPDSEGGSDETSKLINIEYLLKKYSVNLEHIKVILNSIVAITTLDIRQNNISIQQNRKATINNIGFAFTGNVGTGKTTMAVNVSKILYNLDLISNDIVKIVTSYTFEDIDDNMKEASGGVIIFDNFDPLKLNSQCIKRLTEPNTNGSISVLIFITKEDIDWSIKMKWAEKAWVDAAKEIKQIIKCTYILKKYSRDDIKNHFIAHVKNKKYFFEFDTILTYDQLDYTVFNPLIPTDIIITDRHMKIISNHYNGNFINKIFEECYKNLAKRTIDSNDTKLYTFKITDVKTAIISLMRQLDTKYPLESEDLFEIPL